jgi:hypothetical protein
LCSILLPAMILYEFLLPDSLDYLKPALRSL